MKNHKLSVYLYQTLTGQLSIDAYGDMMFVYDSHYIENKKNRPLSQSLPLQEKPYEARQCRPFFSGILPEAHIRTTIARHIEQMAQEAKLSVALVQKEAIKMINTIQNKISDSPFTETILKRADKLSQRFQKI